MAIKISSTEVVSDSRALVNITGATGVYTEFHPAVSAVSSSQINFNIPVNTSTLTANVTFSETNKEEGRTILLLLDTSPNFHTPTFSSNIKWSSNITPGWENYRYWQIILQCVDNTTVRAAAAGYETFTTPAPTETVKLSGNTTNYTTHFGSSPIWSGSAWLLRNGFEFGIDGNLYFLENGNGPPAGLAERIHVLADEWCNVTPANTYYIRATNMNLESWSVAPNGSSDSLNTWLSLNSSTSREFFYTDSSSYGSYGSRQMDLKIEISTAADGSAIIQTGYYTSFWEGGA